MPYHAAHLYWMYAFRSSDRLDPCVFLLISAPFVHSRPCWRPSSSPGPVVSSGFHSTFAPLHLFSSPSKFCFSPPIRSKSRASASVLDLASSSFFDRWLTRRSAHSRPPHLRARFSPHLEPCPASTSPWTATSVLQTAFITQIDSFTFWGGKRRRFRSAAPFRRHSGGIYPPEMAFTAPRRTISGKPAASVLPEACGNRVNSAITAPWRHKERNRGIKSKIDDESSTTERCDWTSAAVRA
jgi:hypothetical protein